MLPQAGGFERLGGTGQQQTPSNRGCPGAQYSGPVVESVGSTEDPVERLVRSGHAAFNSGVLPNLDYWHSDGEYVTAAEDPDSATHRGIEAVRVQFASWVEAYPDLQVEPLEIQVNGDRAFVWVRFSGHGAESKLPVAMELAHIWTVQDGRIRRIEEYMDRADGLKAAGL